MTMSLTLVGIATLFAALCLPFISVISALMVVSVFSLSGTYVLNMEGGVNLLPGPVLAALLCLWLTLKAVIKRTVGRFPRFWGARFLVPFLVYGIVITVCAPLVFGGSVVVIRPNAIADEIREAVPLAFSSSSVAQLTYLVFDAILICAAAAVARRADFKMNSAIMFHLTIGVVLGTAVVLEAALGVTGLPVDFFSYIMGPAIGEPRPDRYSLMGSFGFPIRRAQGIFGEPSQYSAYMLGVYGAALFYARAGRNKLKASMGAVATLLGLVVSFSTTAIVGVFVVTLVVAFAPLGGARSVRVSRTSRWLSTIALLLLFAAVGAAVLSSDKVFDYLFGKLGNTEGYEEGNYSSGAERLYWDLVAGRALLSSFGLGVGAGGTRASSFLLNFAASFGAAGLGLIIVLLRHLWRRFYRRFGADDDIDLRAASVMCLGWFLGFSFAVPDVLSLFYVWVLVGMVLMHTAKTTATREVSGVPGGLEQARGG